MFTRAVSLSRKGLLSVRQRCPAELGGGFWCLPAPIFGELLARSAVLAPRSLRDP